MNILFEISDSVLMIIACIAIVIFIIIAIIFKVVNNKLKVKPISEDERFDNEINAVKIDDNTLTDEQKKAKEELERVFNQMNEDLKKQNETTKGDIDEFERQQEENAIISYQELMAEAEKLKAKASEYEKTAEEKADMEVSSAMNTYESSKQLSLDIEEEKPYRGFKNSDIISPIYGIQNKNARKKTETFSKTNDIINSAYNEIDSDEEKMENTQFLNSLKEFRKNL